VQSGRAAYDQGLPCGGVTDTIAIPTPTPSTADRAALRQRALVGAGIRAAFGVATLVAPGPASRLFGFPKGHDNGSARLMARLFGVRELAMAALVVSALDDDERLGHACAISAAVDVGDVIVACGTFRRDPQLRVASALTMLAGTAGAASWLDLLRRIDD